MDCHAEYLLLPEKSDVPLDTKEVDQVKNKIVKIINTKLNDGITRNQGLAMLVSLLSRSVAKETLHEYGPLWLSKATLSITNVTDQNEVYNACKAIGMLAVNCKDIAEIQKLISIQYVKQWINLIVDCKADKRSSVLFYLIAVLLNHYPEPCERLQVQIRKILLPYLDDTSPTMIASSANCFALLIRATERSFKPQSSNPNCNGWSYNQILLCNNMHELMDLFFKDFVELESNESTEKLELSEIEPEENILDYYDKLKKRFVNLGIWLRTLLRGSKGNTLIMHKAVLRLLCRGLAIIPTNIKNDDSAWKQILFLILPELHVTLLDILTSLIEGCRHELLESAKIILELMQQILNWSDRFSESSTTLSGNKPLSNVRISVYKTLSTWQTCLGSMSGFEMVAEEFLPHLIKDITPEKNRVLLRFSKNLTNSKKSSKKKRKSQYLEDSEQHLGINGDMRSRIDVCWNAPICEQALLALQTIFSSSGYFLRPIFYKSIQQTIVPLLKEIYLERSSLSESLYQENDKCRLNLLKVLSSMQMYSHPTTPPPTQYSVEIFGMAIKEVNPEIVKEVKLALAGLHKILNPSAPSLHRYKPDVEVEEDKNNKKTQSAEKAEMIWEELVGRTEIVVAERKRVNGTCPESPPNKQQRTSLESESKSADSCEERSESSGTSSNYKSQSKEQRARFRAKTKPTISSVENIDCNTIIEEVSRLSIPQENEKNEQESSVSEKPQEENENSAKESNVDENTEDVSTLHEKSPVIHNDEEHSDIFIQENSQDLPVAEPSVENEPQDMTPITDEQKEQVVPQAMEQEEEDVENALGLFCDITND